MAWVLFCRIINSPPRGVAMVKAKIKEPTVPVERLDTIRHRIVSLLSDHASSARQISLELRIPEKEICDHLAHIRRTMHKGAYHLMVEPACCEKCGFTFRKRERLNKPGKCPLCRSESIIDPLFTVVKAN
jgi:predicted Zn-ribbon and HTH transcriptional regulator